MIGAASIADREPSSPTRTGQSPSFRQPAAAALARSPGSIDEMKLPARSLSIPWADVSECGWASA